MKETSSAASALRKTRRERRAYTPIRKESAGDDQQCRPAVHGGSWLVQVNPSMLVSTGL
jgi:hypothetical protein